MDREAIDWVEAETASALTAAGVVAQAGAGVLLLAVSAAELLLGVWNTGWWQQAIVVVFAAVGVAALVRAAVAVGRPEASFVWSRRPQVIQTVLRGA